jgi:hypothetical protein
MELKITRENYREVLENIAEQNGLDVVNTTEGANGYPIGIMPMLKGFETFEQFKTIANQYPQLNHFSLDKKDGWQLWYRKSDYFTGAFELDDTYDNNSNIWYKHEKKEYIYHSLLSTFEVFFSDIYQQESELGITLLDKQIDYNDFEFSNIQQGLQLWERNCEIVEQLQNKTFINKENEEEDLSAYIDFDSVQENISHFEEYFIWFDKQEENKMLVEYFNNGYIDESDIKVCSFYEDTHTYAMALGVSSLSDLEID